MSNNSKTFEAIPTNIISGFLGTGKTTTILSLLENKPEDERWAVLVNEFGEIGIDGALYQGGQAEDGGVYIREVPGGCMCCAVGAPMSAALNQLLRRSKPKRLLIEPTGLGHPKGVLEILRSDNFRDVLDIQKTITLVDARKLSDTRYTEHETFNQQIDVADVIVGNKSDLYQEGDQARLKDYVANRKGSGDLVVLADHGSFDPTLLEGPSDIVNIDFRARHFEEESLEPADDDEPIPECGFLRKENSGEGFFTVGWRFSPDKRFNLDHLLGWLSTVQAERVKAVMNTADGVIDCNQVDGIASLKKRGGSANESRVEIIARETDTLWESGLMDCLIANDSSS
ncbi:MAG: GTP-binding protein [Pseudomonadota bacterium]